MSDDSQAPVESEARAKQRKLARSGALASVLEQAKAMGVGGLSAAASPDSGATARVPPMTAATPPARASFFPGKGPATIPPDACRMWAYADRPEDEFEHLEDVVRSFKSDGQLQPVVVRPVKDPAHPEIRYEVIAGQVRWRAAQRAGTSLDVVVRPMDDEAAFRAMVGENEFRRGLSDYAKAKRLEAALQRGLYKDKQSLAAAVGLSASQLSYYLGFAELDPAVVSRFKRIAGVSARLGYVLNQAVKDGYLSQVLRDLGRIEAGELSRHEIPGVWSAEPVAAPKAEPRRVRASAGPRVFLSAKGQRLFSVATSGASGARVSIAPAAAASLDDAFWDELRAALERRLGTG